jgi:hypothetical protein
MTIFALWIALSIAVGVWANSRGRSGVGWFFLAALISPLLGAIFLAASQNLAAAQASAVPRPETHTRCPRCAEAVLRAATVCKHCGGELVPDPGYTAPPLAPFRTAAQRERDSLMAVAVAVAGTVFIVFACTGLSR